MYVVHAIMHDEPQAGEVSSILPDLLASLNDHDIASAIVTPNKAAANLRAAISKADLVHVHGLFEPFAARVVAEARNAGKPYVLSPGAALTDNPRQRLRWRRKLVMRFSIGKTLRTAARLVACSDHEAGHLSSLGLFDIVVVRPGVDRAKYNPDRNPDRLLETHPALDGKRILLYLGPLDHPSEGLAPMLKAVAPLADERANWHIVLAGTARGRWRTLIEAALRRQRMTDRATILETPDTERQRDLLSIAELLVCPVLRDAVPVAVVQALAAARPVIVSQTLHMPEVAEADAGRVVAPSRRSLLAAFEELLLSTPESLTDMGTRAADLAGRTFDVKQAARKLADVYRSV